MHRKYVRGTEVGFVEGSEDGMLRSKLTGGSDPSWIYFA